MSPSDDNEELVPEDLYQKSFADLSQLQTKLPEDVVISLAREVLERLARELRTPPIHSESVLALSTALVGDDPKAAAKLVEGHLRDGVDANSVYLDYLAPAAKLLGDWWKTDELSFANVSVGTGRIYAIMRTVNRLMVRPQVPAGKSAFFASVPGDDHRLGVRMAADLARKEGWDIELAMDSDHDDLVEAIASSGKLLIGLSGGGIHSVPNLARLVLALRIATPKALILVSGNVADAAADSVRLMHVDGMSRDYDGAMQALATLSRRLAPDNSGA